MMKHTINTCIGLLASIMLFTACTEHEIPFYEGEDTIYFDQQWYDIPNTSFPSARYPHQIYSYIPFGLMAANDSLLKVKIETNSYIRDYDRSFAIEVVADSTTATEGKEFEILDRTLTIPAGEHITYAQVLCHRTERVMSESEPLQLQIRLLPGEHFSLNYGKSGIGAVPGRDDKTSTTQSSNFDPSIHNIFISGVYEKPKNWNAVQLGAFSQKKMALVLRIMDEDFGWNIDNFNEKIFNPQRITLVAAHVADYLMTQYRLGREHWVIDENGYMMYVNGVLWGQSQDPENYN